MSRSRVAERWRRRRATEQGLRAKEAPFCVGLAFAVPYPIGTSALGPMQIYRLIQAEPGMACERVYLPDGAGRGLLSEVPVTVESGRSLGSLSAIALTVAYELELTGVTQLLEAGAIPALRADRDERHPLVLAGGPLTYANPLPLGAFADAIVVGEADELALEALRIVRASPSRAAMLTALAALPSVHVPAIHGAVVPARARAPDSLLPAWSPLWTAESELSDMFLIEAVRGCARSCAYCVMRRGPEGGMRGVPAADILGIVPREAPRVGLVGAGVSDHPQIVPLVRALAGRGQQVGLSSLRPERLDDDLVGALRTAGARSLTVAIDGPSARLRALLDRRCGEADVVSAARLARKHGLARLKLYAMVGLPTEQDDDLAELVALCAELSGILPVSLAVSPFCPKHHTPLAQEPFAGIAVTRRRLEQLRAALAGRVDLRAASARWAWVEHQLAQGTEATGRAMREAVRAGGGFRAIVRALEQARSP